MNVLNFHESNRKKKLCGWSIILDFQKAFDTLITQKIDKQARSPGWYHRGFLK